MWGMKSMTFWGMVKHNADLSKSEVWVKFFVYPLSMPISFFLIRYTKISANAVTLIGMLAALSGAVIGLKFGLAWIAVGYFIAYICDFVDGQVARAKGSSPIGAVLDMLSDRTALITAAIAIAYHLYLRGDAKGVLVILQYISLYFINDSIRVVAKNNTVGVPVTPQSQAEINNTIASVFGNPWNWVPHRLSSPVFILLTWLATDKVDYAFFVGIMCCVFDLLSMAMRKIAKITKKQYNQTPPRKL